MSNNEERRLAIMAELVRRADGAEAKYFNRISPAVATMIQECGDDTVELMGMFRALMKFASRIAYGSVATPSDLQMRIGEDLAAIATQMWNEACLNGESMKRELAAKGVADPELDRKVKLAPSDPSKRPDLKPIEPVPEAQRPKSVADLMSRLDTTEIKPGRGYGGMEN